MRQGTKVDDSDDGLTKAVTAFADFRVMVTVMRVSGYCPTLRVAQVPRPKTKEGRRTAEFNRKVVKLRRRVLEEGFPVFFDGKVHWGVEG